MTKDIPAQQANLLIDELLWPDHPLGRDIAGTKESVTAISRDNLTEYLKRQYQPDNAVVAIAGNIQHREMISAVSQMLGGWTGRQPHLGYTAYQPKLAQRLHIEKRKTEQAHLCLAVPGLPLLHPQRFTLDLLNVILGEGMSSRLRMEDSRNVSGWLGGQEILTERILSPDQIISIIDAITAEELKKLAQELIADSKLHLAVVGPITEDEPLEKLLSI